jgi:hypothetical protein
MPLTAVAGPHSFWRTGDFFDAAIAGGKQCVGMLRPYSAGPGSGSPAGAGMVSPPGRIISGPTIMLPSGR